MRRGGLPHAELRMASGCAGLKLDCGAVEGLAETLGKNGVTSNYRFDLAPYTWKLVEAFKGGTALFTQPPMPIKCAGAPQKAMYLSCDHWRERGVVKSNQVEFLNAGSALFGVADYVPPLMEHVDMIHVVAPQTASDFVRASPLAAESGWVAIDQSTLRHVKYENIYSLGDAISATNAKTAAAVRKQAPVVAQNLLADMGKLDTRGPCQL